MNEGYAVATVVGRSAPVSSHLGDRAIVYADGRMEGFVGGSCSREIVRRQALRTLVTGEARMLHIRPGDAAGETLDDVTVPMTCVSEGAIDVFIEPHLPRRRVLIAGFTPVAQALAQMAPLLDYDAVRFAASDELAQCEALPIESLDAYLREMDEGVRERSAAVVASQGHYDDAALAAVLRYDLAYTGLLASRKRGAAVLVLLAGEGISSQRLQSVRYPAGLEIGARRAAEVALSIFAQIVACTRESLRVPAPEAGTGERDPVCGMEVEAASAHRAEFAGRTYLFCCPHCRAEFLANPDRYAAAPA